MTRLPLLGAPPFPGLCQRLEDNLFFRTAVVSRFTSRPNCAVFYGSAAVLWVLPFFAAGVVFGFFLVSGVTLFSIVAPPFYTGSCFFSNPIGILF